MMPLGLAPNLINHFYRGGDRIARLRAIEQTSEFQPEEWLGATVSRAGHGDVGLARTFGGVLLRDLVAVAPEAWIGPDHALATNSTDTGLLVKLLDARQRLPVHVHPAREFAASHLDCPYGKSEAWFVLDTEPGATVHLGWSSAVDRDELDRRRDAQDSEWMLAHMNSIEVSRGMGIFVPAGTVHAIGEGIFVAEVQEPTDFSILLEWSQTTSTKEELHLGLGFDAVMPAVSTDALRSTAIERLVVQNDLDAQAPESGSLLPKLADPYFRLLYVAAGGGRSAPFDPGFAVALVLDGKGSLVGVDGELEYAAGDAFAVPASFGRWEIQGSGCVLVAKPGLGWPTTLNLRSLP